MVVEEGLTMNKERLLRLADYLEKVDADRFNLGMWGEPGFEEDVCGTMACACGWATVLFKDEGLKLVPNTLLTRDLYYDGEINWNAADAFFDLVDDQAWWLFSHHAYDPVYEEDMIGPSRVVERIRGFVADAQDD